MGDTTNYMWCAQRIQELSYYLTHEDTLHRFSNSQLDSSSKFKNCSRNMLKKPNTKTQTNKTANTPLSLVKKYFKTGLIFISDNLKCLNWTCEACFLVSFDHEHIKQVNFYSVHHARAICLRKKWKELHKKWRCIIRP